jgi:hypothetical protein
MYLPWHGEPFISGRTYSPVLRMLKEPDPPPYRMIFGGPIGGAIIDHDQFKIFKSCARTESIASFKREDDCK